MQIKFNLSNDTIALLQPDGRYVVRNKTGSISLTIKELKELKNVNDLAEASKGDLPIEG